MLGLMNCPTENQLDFYASSPCATRLLSQSAPGSGNNSKKSSDASIDGSLGGRCRSNALEVFSEVKEKPQISYTGDGRRLINGKLEESSQGEPGKLWNRVIVDSITTNKLCCETDAGKANCAGEGHSPRAQSAVSQSTEGRTSPKQKQKRSFSFSVFLPMLKTRKSSGQERKKKHSHQQGMAAQQQ